MKCKRSLDDAHPKKRIGRAVEPGPRQLEHPVSTTCGSGWSLAGMQFRRSGPRGRGRRPVGVTAA